MKTDKQHLRPMQGTQVSTMVSGQCQGSQASTRGPALAKDGPGSIDVADSLSVCLSVFVGGLCVCMCVCQ